MDGHALALLPALDGGHVAVKIGGDLLPGVQTILGLILGWQWTWEKLGHLVLLGGAVTGDLSWFILTPSRGSGKRRYLTANGHSVCCRLTNLWQVFDGSRAPQV